MGVPAPFRKFVVVGEHAWVGDLLEREWADESHEDLRDRLLPDFRDLPEAEKERLERETTYGWLVGEGNQLRVSMPSYYEDRAGSVLAALAGWAARERVTLELATPETETTRASAGFREETFALERAASEHVWANRRPWIAAKGEIVIGEAGQFHDDLARSHGVTLDAVDALGEIVGPQVRVFRGEPGWISTVEAASFEREA